ncbi:MAG: DUF1800 domain-containing protein [Pseudomonadota bacterium]|nr:DUF1800 domain-containing protein [Pseudomonadota bacterium]
MQRRTFLQIAGYSTVYGSLLADLAHSAAALEPAEIAGTDADLHLLRRISFGPTAATLVRVRGIGRSAYIDEQLATTDAFSDLTAKTLYPLINTKGASIYLSTLSGLAINVHQLHLQSAMLYRALFSKAQLYELMVDFWNDHFNTYLRKNPIPLKIDLDRDVIRVHALGNFKTLLKATVRSGEMLHYLDNWLNRSGQINENYARELLELHSLGKDGGYSEADMKALARILSGLGIVVDLPLAALAYGKVQFTAAQHDKSAKTFLGQSFPAGGGQAEIDRALNLIADHPGTARFIALKLCRRFVADNPPQALVTRVASAFTQSNGDIKTMLRVILNSTEFASSAGSKLKRPQEAMIGAMRACGVTLVEQIANVSLSGIPIAAPNGLLFNSLVQAGHEPFAWVPPNGYPDLESYWANTNTALYQQKFLVKLVEGINLSYVLSNPLGVLNGISFATSVTRATTPRQAVRSAITNLLFTPLPAAAEAACVDFVAQYDSPDAAMVAGTLEQRVKGLVFVLLASPWFLRR